VALQAQKGIRSAGALNAREGAEGEEVKAGGLQFSHASKRAAMSPFSFTFVLALGRFSPQSLKFKLKFMFNVNLDFWYVLYKKSWVKSSVEETIPNYPI